MEGRLGRLVERLRGNRGWGYYERRSPGFEERMRTARRGLEAGEGIDISLIPLNAGPEKPNPKNPRDLPGA